MHNWPLSDPFDKEKPEEKLFKWWAFGVFFLGFFFFEVFDPTPDHATLHCYRSKNICIIERSGFFRTRIDEIKIDEIRNAYFEKFGFFMGGYNGPNLKTKTGNSVLVGVRSSPPWSSAEENM